MKGKKICIRKGYSASGKTVNTWNSSRMFIVFRPIIARLRSLRASSPGRSGGKAGKEGGLATTSLEFEYMHRKSQCEMLIGGDDISNDVITLGACFHAFFNVCLILARFRFALIGGNLAAQSTGSHRGIGGGIQIPSDSLRFPPRPATRAPRRACSQASHKTTN